MQINKLPMVMIIISPSSFSFSFMAPILQTLSAYSCVQPFELTPASYSCSSGKPQCTGAPVTFTSWNGFFQRISLLRFT